MSIPIYSDDPTPEEILDAMRTLHLDKSEHGHYLNVRRVFLDFMRGRMAAQQQELWARNGQAAPSSVS